MRIHGLRHQAWIAVADSDSCRLLECGITEFGTHHVREVRRFEDLWPRDQRLQGAVMPERVNTVHRMAFRARVHEVATTIINRLTHERAARRIDTLAIVAPRRLLRSLERLLGTSDTPFKLCEGSLAEYTPTALSVHPQIRSLIELCRPPERNL